MLQPYLDALASGDFTAGLVILFALLIAHALCDHPLQGDYVALHKSRHFPKSSPDAPTVWPYCLSVHSLIHAGGVWVVTGSPLFGLIEFVLHWIIDFLKSEKLINLHIDQMLHVLTKVGYVVALAYV